MKGIEEITYEPLPGNISLGVFAFRILASGEALDAEQIVQIIDLLESTKFSEQYKTVSLEGFDEDSSESWVYTLCQTLKDYKYRLRVVSDGTMFHSWYKLADHLVVFVEDRLSWTKFRAHQIVYSPQKDLKEPDLPPLDANTWLYLDTTGMNEKQCRAFLREARHAWGIYKETMNLAGEPVLEQVLYQKE